MQSARRWFENDLIFFREFCTKHEPKLIKIRISAKNARFCWHKSCFALLQGTADLLLIIKDKLKIIFFEVVTVDSNS